MKYICWYEFDRVRRLVVSNEGIWPFAEGFWINDFGTFTKGSDAKYWIPPSKIIYISKENEEMP